MTPTTMGIDYSLFPRLGFNCATNPIWDVDVLIGGKRTRVGAIQRRGKDGRHSFALVGGKKRGVAIETWETKHGAITALIERWKKNHSMSLRSGEVDTKISTPNARKKLTQGQELLH